MRRISARAAATPGHSDESRSTTEPTAVPALRTRGLAVGYGDLAVVRDLDLTVARGATLAVLGPNGAGKTTTLRTLAGLLKPLSGEVELAGRATRAGLHLRARSGLAYIPEDRGLIPALSVRDNLRLGRVDIDEVIASSPALEPLLHRRAGLLSGGEQQLLTIARALGRRPTVLLIDELSQGLSPLAVDAVCALLNRATETGTAVVVVEQVLDRALALSDTFVVLRQGAVALTGASTDYRNRLTDIEQLHLATVN